MRHEIGTVPSFEVSWLFVVWSETPPAVDDGLVVDLANAEFVAGVLYAEGLEFGGTIRTKAVDGDGISSTSTCCPRVTERSPGHPGELTWSAMTQVVVATNSQL